MFRLSQILRSPEDTPPGGPPATPPSTPPATPPTTPPAAAPPQTVVTPPATPPSTPPAAGKWPDTWRQEMVGNDEKELKQAERYATPADVWKKARELEKRLSEGVKPAPFPADGTDEAKAEWRKQNGVPDKPADYLAKLPDGLVIGEEDKATVDGFAERLHKINASPAVVHEAIAWYNDYKAEQEAAIAEADTKHSAETEDALRAEWGADYRANTNIAKTFIEKTFGEEDAAAFMNARTLDGKALLNIPGVVKALVQWGRELLPGAAITPSGEGDLKSMANRKAEIETIMRTKRSEYNRNTAMQAEYRKILEAEQRMAERGGKAA